MNPSHPDPERAPAPRFSLLRPAVSTRSEESSRPAGEPAPRPLGPFSRAWPEARASVAETSGQATPPAPAAEPHAGQPERGSYALESEPEDDLPWTTRGQLREEAAAEPADEPAPPAFGYETETVAAEPFASWLEFDTEVDEAAAAVEEMETEGEPAPAPAVPEPARSLGDELLAPPEWEYGYDAAPGLGTAPPDEPSPEDEPELEPVTVATPADTPSAVKPAALEDVAARLERIARSLRGGSPAELLTNTDDPLQVLIAGYALGLADAARHPSDPHG